MGYNNRESFEKNLGRFPELKDRRHLLDLSINLRTVEAVFQEIGVLKGRLPMREVEYSNFGGSIVLRRRGVGGESAATGTSADGLELEPAEMLVEALTTHWIWRDGTWLTMQLDDLADKPGVVRRILERVTGKNRRCISRVLVMGRNNFGSWVLTRRRPSHDTFSGLYEIPGGELPKEAYRTEGYWGGVPHLPDYVLHGDTELDEEVGELVPSPVTRKGIGVTLVGNGDKTYLDVTEVAVVEYPTLFHLAALANSRSERANRENVTEGSKDLWTPVCIPTMMEAERFLPATAMLLQRVLNGQTIVSAGGYSGISVFMPYDMLSIVGRLGNLEQILCLADLPEIRKRSSPFYRENYYLD